ncbi:uncharacterized protein LOC110919136 [Helianthus annuus]|uniref:uncharacterized protein LOC110919136 n=1 Tax=Helianthus annuus TaxID=4232 RepID=UPI000B8F5551|nr:uncharacterized protein LOC110919136 [Helianthus annuus]
MVHKHVEALDRTMTDVFSEGRSIRSDIPFGGKVIVFGGDFRQILHVIPNGTRQEIVSASLSSSYIWAKCRLLRLTKNMRLTIGAESSNMKSIIEFAKWLIDIGEGNVGDDNDGDAIIEIPDDLLITDIYDPIQSLIDFVYPSIIQQFRIAGFFSERAILAPKNEVVHEINDRLLSLFPGDAKEYLSSDILRVGVPVMLLRNIDQQKGLCNGTRLQITFLGKRVIEAERLPAEVARRAGLSLDLHPLKVQNMVGVVEVYDVKLELNELKPRYALDGWRKFMTDNNLRFFS